MATYSMAEIVSLTGLNAHTLRKWESRYDIILPHRTETNIRYYSDNHLRKLLNIGILVRNGRRISQVDTMTDDEINHQVSEILVDSKKPDAINALIISMIKMDELAFDKIIDRNIRSKGLLSTVTELIYPFLNQIGILWSTHRAMPAQEHFISNLIRQKLFAAIEKLPMANVDAPKVVLFLLEDEDHEIGLLLGSFLARQLGWKVYYLGQKVPIGNIEKVVEIVQPKLLVTMFIIERPKWVKSKISAITTSTNIPLVVSGNTQNFIDIEISNRLLYPKSAEELVTLLSSRTESVELTPK
jgi:DNA-binding transcriptional MerR regulator